MTGPIGQEPLGALPAVLTTNTAPTMGKINLYNASAGPLTAALPALAGLNVGARVVIEVDPADTSGNTVTLACNGTDTFYSGATVEVLRLRGQKCELQVVQPGGVGAKKWKTLASTPLTGLDSRYLEVQNRAALVPFWAKMANRDAATVKLLHIGDSISAGARCGSWPAYYGSVLAKRLMSAYPCINGNPVGGQYYPACQSSVNGPAIPESHTGTPVVDASYGPGFTNYLFNAACTMTFTVTGTSAKLWVVQALAARTFSMSIDGAAATTVTVPAATSVTDGYQVPIAFAAAGSHTVAITWTGDNVYVVGIDVYNGDEAKGFHAVPAGHSGWGANDYTAKEAAAPASRISQMVASVGPAVTTIMLCTNDWGKGLRTSAQFGTDMLQLISEVKAGAPTSSILLVAPMATKQSATNVLEPFANYVAALKAIATADTTVAYVDLGKTMPGNLDAQTYGLYYTDQIHPVAPGHTLLADLLFNALQPMTAA